MTNIAKILKECPKGTKLYSPICGECELDCLCYNGDVITVVYGGRENANYSASEYEELDRNHVLCFDRYGKYESTGEVMLFPSNNCRDWGTMKVTQNCNKENSNTKNCKLEALKLVRENVFDGLTDYVDVANGLLGANIDKQELEWNIEAIREMLKQDKENELMKERILELVSISGNGNDFEEIKNWLEGI